MAYIERLTHEPHQIKNLTKGNFILKQSKPFLLLIISLDIIQILIYYDTYQTYQGHDGVNWYHENNAYHVLLMKTKELLGKIGISEPTLRRYLRQDSPIPELLEVPQDWRGHRNWTEEHVRLILEYKKNRLLKIKERQKPYMRRREAAVFKKQEEKKNKK